MAFTIEVWRGNNRAKNTRVGVTFSGFLRGTTESHTDNQGRAFFSNDTGNGSVYIDGKCRYTGMLKGDVKITLGLFHLQNSRLFVSLFFYTPFFPN